MPRNGPLLPTEPRIADWDRQHALTERYLAPAAAELEALFRRLRADLDPELARVKPVKLGKSYPLGQCLEISDAVLARLQRVDGAALGGAAAAGWHALDTFMREGGTIWPAWGDLRGEYFQNATLIGTLYVDVANDTVVPTKPPVEILPLAQANFRPIEDYVHFATVASRYWRARIFPNHIAPALAPYFPLVAAIPGGGVRFESTSDYMVALTMAEAFRPSEAVLKGTAMDAGMFRLLAGCLEGSSLEIPADPQAGRDLALRTCRDRRAEAPSQERRAEAVVAVLEANRRLAHLHVRSAPASG